MFRGCTLACVFPPSAGSGSDQFSVVFNIVKFSFNQYDCKGVLISITDICYMSVIVYFVLYIVVFEHND